MADPGSSPFDPGLLVDDEAERPATTASSLGCEAAAGSPNAAADQRRLVADWAALSVDVETLPADGQRIFRLGAVRSDAADRQLNLAIGRQSTDEVTRSVDAVTAGAKVLVGHNLRRHDLPELRRQYPQLACLGLPVIDTLEWSVMAFPTNPYHGLVKGYKLVTDGRNDPLRDARLTLELLGDEVEAFAVMQAGDPAWLALLHALVAGDGPLDRCLGAVRGASAPEPGLAGRSAMARFATSCCATRLAHVVDEDSTAAPQPRFDLALALGWIRVSGGNSVLPGWVYRSMPKVRRLIAELREHDCGEGGCRWCREQHDPERLLKLHFGLDGFRPLPAAAGGGSLQRAIVAAGLARRSLLAVLPTGGGKSICYQLPALVHYARTGQLTVIVSPLQSLMKDQVDNLVKAGVGCAVTINGLLSPLERRAALDKIRLGDAGIVLVSPEQFRSRTFVDAIGQREIATWVFDEAHCLSKWGHDFRTDYLYVSRFVRERAAGLPAPVACFTATARPDVIDELCAHFRGTLGVVLERHLGGHGRPNLAFQVIPSAKADKPLRVVEILQHELRLGGAGVVFCATKKSAEAMAEAISARGLACGCFHGGLDADAKKSAQRRFLDGELAVMAATNAFGMGVDKPDIRVVVHAQIPGSLENYLQEAGRAGRDGGQARCILLFDPEDVETQFRLSAQSKLTPRDFASLLRAVRGRAGRLNQREVVVSPKELLAGSDGADIDIESPDAVTKVTTAVAWLERAGFLRRHENHTRVFPASLRVASLAQAVERIGQAQLPPAARAKYIAVASTLFRHADPAGVSTDELMLESGIEPQECFRILHQLESLGVIANDLGISVRLTKGVKGAADKALERLDELERRLLELMSEQAPDADQAAEPQLLNLRPVCTEVRRRMGLPASDGQVTPDRILSCLRSMSDGFGAGGHQRSLLRTRGREAVQVVLHRAWSWIRMVCQSRRTVAQVVLRRLLEALPLGTKGANLVVECKARDLIEAIESDVELRQRVREPAAALEHALLYLHDNRVLELDRGRSVFRSAMTIELDRQAARRRFTKDDYAPLEEFYRERTLQTHVMHEYARLGAEDPDRAAALVAAYFTLPRRQFVREHFKGRAELLELATTDESFRRIVDELAHPVQQRLVEAPERGNHLVLAGPGSGKTRVIVHRIAYLLRVRRVSPDGIIALAFNRGAAAELRRRLIALAGDDARRVTVLTYHALALRLTGTSLEAAARLDARIDFDQLIRDAIDLLNGGSDAFMDADDARDRLLQGYEYIFVDEYQDIDEAQYQLVSALAGRRARDADARLNIMAVGDDDQNIYAFKGASAEFIRRFQVDYGGEVTCLVENFRSTQNIIAAAHHVIQAAAGRMKVDHPIRIDNARSHDPPGGPWQGLDPEHGGRVRLVAVPASANLQAQVVMQQVQRILAVAPETALGRIAVLARTHRSLEPLRALCEDLGLRCELQAGEGSRLSFMQLREGHRVVQQLPERRSERVELGPLRRWLADQVGAEPDNPHWPAVAAAVDDGARSSAVDQLTVQDLLDALYEAADDARRRGRADALALVTAHAAKGLEFDHVIVMDCGDWRWDQDDDRRLLYVAMTRARLTLDLMRSDLGRGGGLADLGSVDGVVEAVPAVWPAYRPQLDRRSVTLGPADVDLGFAGRMPAHHAVQAALGDLRVGDTIRVEARRLKDGRGRVIGRLSTRCDLAGPDLDGKVVAIMVRTRARTAAPFQSGLQLDRWEVPLVEVVLR